MTEKGRGQYDIEYKDCPCFWGKEASKYAKLIPNHKNPPGDALDLGAGEGKNSFYLASLGYKVTAVEVSCYAVRNFINRLIKEKESGEEMTNRMTVILGDVLDWPIRGSYDIIVSYGFLHCLESKKMVSEITNRTKEATKKGGLNVVCTFTNDLPVPEIQRYLTPTLLSGEEVRNLYKDWKILEYEVGTVAHSHPTSETFHKHSVCRMIAQKKN